MTRPLAVGTDPLDSRAPLSIDDRVVVIYRLDRSGAADLGRLPVTVKILLENLLRHAGDGVVSEADVRALAGWRPRAGIDIELPFMPARVILQDFTGVPAVVDLAAMRDAMAALGGDPARINPLVPADLVIDHSVQVDRFGNDGAFAFNVAREYERNGERYQLLRWAQTAFSDLRVVPPGTGIVHQVNLEYLAAVVQARADGSGATVAYPDTLVGTDSHTTMVNALGVLGYGVGGIEAEAVLLGQPLYQPMPTVVGVRLHGELPIGSTATDLVLVVTELLRGHGVVGAFVEFAGDGLAGLTLADRATISNMSPEFGATAAIFPIDDETLTYLRLTGRATDQVALVEAYAREQGLWREPGGGPDFDETLELDLASVEPSLAGPRRPQDRVPLPSDPRELRGRLPGRAAGQRRQQPGDGRGRPRRRGRADRRHRRSGRHRDRWPRRHHPQRRGGHRRHHVVHQHQQPDGHGRGRPPGAQRGRARPDGRPDGQDQPRPGLPRGHALPRGGRAHGAPRRAGLRSRRLRLHDLHRQLRAARRTRRSRRRGARPGGRRGPLGQPQLRGPHPPARSCQLPRQPAAGRRLRAGGPRRHRSDPGTARRSARTVGR